MKISIPYRHKRKCLTSFVGDALGPTVGLDDGCSKDREQEISCVSKCDVEVSSKSQEIESTTNNRSSLPQPKDSMLATQTDFYLGSARATSLDSTMAREQEISIVSKCDVKYP